MNPTARSMKWACEQGWDPTILERWNPHARIRQDAWGFADLAIIADATPAVEGTHELLFVQATSGSNHASRVAKVEASEAARKLMRVPGVSVQVWSWTKKGPRGERKLWTLRRERL